jgi:hypothetical protein
MTSPRSVEWLRASGESGNNSKHAADRERMQMRRSDEAFRELEVLCNLCAITQSVCGISNACLLFQNAGRRDRRADPAVRESVVSLLQQPTLCTSMTSFF